jgi:hypothetical protein
MISSQVQPRSAVQSGMNWWKVTLDSSGAILTCEQVDTVSKGTSRVTYVQATCKAEACSAAKFWWDRVKAHNRARAAERKLAKRSRGLCETCGKTPPETKRRKCRRCLDRLNERAQARLAGAPRIRPTYASAEEAHRVNLENQRKYRESRRAERRCNLRYTDLLRKFDEIGPAAFRAWLASRAVSSDSAQAAE